MTDEEFMSLAIEEAEAAQRDGDVPIGAVAVHQGEVIARAGNRRERDQDPTAHAEILVLRQAASKLGTWRLQGLTLYVTLEPCPMCAGALVAGRVDRLVYGAADERAGAAYSLYNIVQDPRLNHQTSITAGVLGDRSIELLQSFFRERRSAGGPV